MIFQDFFNLDETVFNTKAEVDAVQLVRLGFFSKAIDLLSQKKKPTKKEKYLLAVCYQKTNQYHEALKYYTELAGSDANNLYHVLGQADCYFRLNQPQKALLSYKKTLSKLEEDHPKYIFVLRGSADIYFFLEKFDIAEVLYSQCIELNPSCDHSLSQLGYIYFQKKLINESVKVLRKSMKLNSENETTLYYCALVYQFIGDVELCTGYLDALLDINPKHFKALKLWTEVQIQLTAYEKVIYKIQNSTELFAGDEKDWHYYTLSKSYLLKGRPHLAQEYLNKISLKSNFKDFLELSKAIQLCLSEV